MGKFFSLLITMPFRYMCIIIFIVGLFNTCRSDIPEVDKYIYEGEIVALTVKNYIHEGGFKRTLYSYMYVDTYGNKFEDEKDVDYRDNSFIIENIKAHKLYRKNDIYSIGPYIALGFLVFLIQVLIFVCLMDYDLWWGLELILMLTPFYLISEPYSEIFDDMDGSFSGTLKKFFGYES